MQTKFVYLRDILMFILLAALVQRYIVETFPEIPPETPGKDSLHAPDIQDINMLQDIHHNKKVIKHLLETHPTPEQRDILNDTYNQLTAIEKEYTYISPGLALLGPLSSLYLVLKQKGLREKSERLVKQINQA